MSWIKAEIELPNVWEYVQIFTPYCKAHIQPGYWTGEKWMAYDSDTEILNVEYWMPMFPAPVDFKKIIPNNKNESEK